MELRRFISRHFYIFIAVLFQSTVCLFVCALLACNSLVSHMNSEKFADYFVNREYYLMTDTGDENGSYREYMNAGDHQSFSNLLSFVQELRSQNYFSFCSMVSQPLTFAASDVVSNQFFDPENGLYDSAHKNIKCMQISSNVFDLFGLSIHTGSSFTKDDYSLEKDQFVSVLLGADYQAFYRIGDTFQAIHGITRLTFKVIGFLEAGSIIPEGGRLVDLGSYMVIPAFEKYDFSSYREYARINLSQQANGSIICTRKNLNISEYIDRLSQKYSTFSFIISPIVSKNLNELAFLSKDIVSLLSALNWFVFIFTALSMVITTYTIIKKDRAILGVHYLCGAGQNDIAGIIAVEILVMIMTSMAIATAMIGILRLVHPALIGLSILAYGTILLFVVFALSSFLLNHLSIDQMLRRNHL